MTANVTRELSQRPVSIAAAGQPAGDGGLPASAGFYAWWLTESDALAAVPRTPHPTDGLSLLYVGIAPSRPSSRATLRSRVLRQHVRGNLAASTFRRSLAALLWRDQGWVPLRRASGKLVFSAADNAALTQWQEDHLQVSWCENPEPWAIEHAVIQELRPPLNVDFNAGHTFHAAIKAARAECLAAARPA